MGEVQENQINPVLADFARLLQGDLSAHDAEQALRAITERAKTATLAARDAEKRALDESMSVRGKIRDSLVAGLRAAVEASHKEYRQIDPACSAISYRVDVTDDGAGNLTVVPVGFPAISAANGASKKKLADGRKPRRDAGIPRDGNTAWATGLKCSCGEQVMSRENALSLHRDKGHVIGEVSATAPTEVDCTNDAAPAPTATEEVASVG